VLRVAAAQAAQHVPLSTAICDLARRARVDLVVPDQPVAEQPALLHSFGLTDRELAVLRLLPGQLSQREMADTLFVSLNTVKSHLRSIYRKLGVNTRDAAVSRARELGVL
jgi:LuxR family maltose regulon positive regulatory protein